MSRTAGAKLIGRWIGEDLSRYEPGQDLRQHGTPAVAGIARGYSALFPHVQAWDADALADQIKLGGMGPKIVGGPATVADGLQKWIDEADVDGFSKCR